MKKIILFTIGLLITLIGFSQSKVKVYGSFNYYISMIIPFGEMFILEEYSKIKFYNLESTDTLEIINDSVYLKYAGWINIDNFSKEYDFCDKQINKVRNFALTQRIHFMLNDTCNKYIGADYKEYHNFSRELTFDTNYLENVCSDKFSLLIHERFDSILKVINEIYDRKVQRTEWIKKNYVEIDNKFIESFLIDFSHNQHDEETFIQILITQPAALIEEIDNLDMRNKIIWRVRLINNIDGISKAIESLEKTDLKCKTKKQILKELKKKSANI